MITLEVVSLALCAFTLAGLLTGRLYPWQFFGLAALCEFLVGLSCALSGHRVLAAVLGAVAAILAYLWWKTGGGDDTRRRLRKLRRAFTGVRRTAPTTT